MTRPFATAVILALCLVLSGCDSTQFFYNRAHWLLAYRADHYLDLNAEQKPNVKREINRWLDWHRRSQLICYAELIGQFEARSQNAMSNADLDWLEAESIVYYQTLLDKAFDPAAIILSKLDSDQIDHLEKRLRKEHVKLARELKSDRQRRLRHRDKKTLASIKQWFGKLSHAQIVWLSKYNQSLPDAFAPWLQYRVQRDDTLIRLLRSGADPKRITAVTKPMWLDGVAFMNSDDQVLMAELKTRTKAMAVMFYAMASAKQKTHFWNRLRGYRSDFIQLASASANTSCQNSAVRLTDN